MENVDFERIERDVNGNSRIVIHYSEFLTKEEQNLHNLRTQYNTALDKARKLGGKKYRGKNFAGGFVFQTHPEIIPAIQKMRGW